MMRTILFSSALVLAAWGFAPAQTIAPVPANGGSAAVLNAAEVPRSNYVNWGARVGTHFDDNALNTTSNPVRDDVSQFQPWVTLNLTRPRWQWMLDYRPSFDYSLNVPNYSLHSQVVGTDLLTRISKRLSLRLRESFGRSSNPFDWLEQSSAVGAPPATLQVNPSVFGVPLLRTTEQGGADFLYALGPHSSLGVGGIYSTQDYRPLDKSTGFGLTQDQQTASGHVYYSRQFTRRQWTGVQFTYQDLKSFQGSMRTQVQSVVYSHTVSLTQKLTVSGFAGPQHSRTVISTRLLPAGFPTDEESAWSWSAGGNLSWRSGHTQASAGVYQQISDGAGYLGTVRLRAVSADLQRQLSRLSTIRLALQYNMNDPIGSVRLYPGLDYLSVMATYSRQLTDHFAFDATYWRGQQSAYVLAPSGLGIVNNRFSVGFSFQFNRPIGR